MWQKVAVKMGIQYIWLIIEVWAQEKKRLGSKDVSNVRKAIEVLVGVLLTTGNTSVTGEEVAEFLEKL